MHTAYICSASVVCAGTLLPLATRLIFKGSPLTLCKEASAVILLRGLCSVSSHLVNMHIIFESLTSVPIFV
jgi:hypothetical protein